MTTTHRLLDGATSLLGALTPECRARIVAFLDDPTHATWEGCYAILINGRIGPGMRIRTMWQAVMAADPTFPMSRGSNDSWPRIPDALTAARGIRLALGAS